MEKKGGYAGPRFSSYKREPRREHWDPIDLDAIEHGRSSRLGKPRFNNRGYGGNKERERRRRDNLCYNCGKSRHQARECNSNAQRLYMMNDKTGMIEKKANTIMKTSEALDGLDKA